MASPSRKTSLPPTLGMVLKGYPRISETFIAGEIHRLEEEGFRIHLFSMRHPRENFAHRLVERIRARVDYLPTELDRDFSRLLLPAVLVAVRNPSRFRKVLARAGARFARSRSLATLKHFLQGCYLAGHLLPRHPEVVHLHAHFAHSPTSVALFAAKLSGLEFSFTGHAKDVYTSRPDQLQEKIARARMVITCTQYNAGTLSKIAAGATTPIHCVYHGIDLSQFAFVRDRPAPRPPYRLLTVARLTGKKGVDTVLDALALLQERGMEWQYTLIGDGDERDRIMTRIVDLGLAERVRWLGVRPHDDVIREFARADLFVLGCRVAESGDRDGIPNVLVESLAMGLPAVGTTVSGLPEILVPEQTGLVVPPDDPGAMARAVERLLTDRELRHRVQVKGRQWVEERFDNRVLAGRLARILRQEIPALDGR